MIELNTIHLGDCIGYMVNEMKDRTVDFIFTDPPYWTLNKWRDMGTTTRLGGNKDKEKQTGWFETIDAGYLWDFMCECWRILKPDRHVCIMCDSQTIKWVLWYAEEAGFNYYKPIIWDKVNQGMGYHLRCRYEFVVLLDKGKNRKPKNLSAPDIFVQKALRTAIPTEKPVELPQFFIEQFTEPGEIVFDGFMGSGSTAVACLNTGRKFIGTEKDFDNWFYATERLNGETES